jgi:chromosome segregation ATPase
MKIDDEIFELGGESTLLALRNGGGKSVMVQIVMAPFVNKRYRDLKDRPFKDYFTSPSPTYILTEWVLDGGVGHVLIGMMVRKKTSYSDDDSGEELDITNFVYEYDPECQYDIRNFPVIEEGEKTKRIKSYTSTKGLFEKLKKDKNIIFNYFDMGAAYQSKSYFNNLKQYKINHKEWESIIKKVNMKESGLSELFQEAKNVSGLVEKWFIKTVEDKLNREENKVRNFSEIVKKYIYQYRENQSKIDKKEAIEKFHLCAEDILREAESFLGHRNTSHSLRNKIANLISFLENSLNEENQRKEQLELMISEIEEYIKEIRYEELSVNVYDIEDRALEINKEKEEKQEEASTAYEKIEILQKQQWILECAKIYEEYVKASKDVQKYENQIEIIKEKNKDLEPERENIGFTLNKHYESKEKEVSRHLWENEANIKTAKKNMEKAKSEIDEINKKLQENSRVKGELQSNINSYVKEENRFNARYKKSFARNLMGYYSEDFINKTTLEYNEDLKKKEEALINDKKLYEKKSLEIKVKERERDDLIKELSNAANELQNMKNQKSLFDDEIEKRKKIIRYIDVDENKLFDSEYIINEFNSRIRVLKEEENKLVIRLSRLEDEKRKLQTGRTLEIPKEIEEKLRQRDIKIIYGMDWIKKNNYSEEKNKKLIESNPFLPYSLIMENEDLIKLEKEELGVFTSYPIPIVKRDSLASESKENTNGLCSLNGITFYIAFNNKLINEEELRKLLNEKQKEIDSLKEALELKKRDIEFYESNKSIIQFSSLDKEVYEKLQNQMVLKEEELSSKENSLNHIRDNIKEISSIIDKTNRAIRTAEKEIIEFKREIEDFNILIIRYEIYRIDKEKLDKLEENIKEIKNDKNIREKDRVNLEESLSNLQEGFRDLKGKLKKTQENLNKYSQYNDGEIIKKDIEDLEARYDSLSREISSDIKLLEDNLKDANERLKTKEEDLIFKSEEYNLNEDEYREVTYDRFKEEEIKREVKAFREELEKIKSNIEELNITLAKLQRDIENLYKRIKEDFNKEKPKEREEIINRDFGKRIFEKQHKLEEVKKEKKVSISTIDKIENNLSNLEEFKDFTITEEINIDVEVQSLNKYRGELQRDYRQSLEEEGKKRVDLSSEINKVARKPVFLEDDFFRRSLETIERSVDEPEVVIENLNITLDAHKALIEKLQADIDLITREKENVCQSLYEYILEVHNNIGKIDNNSSIKIRDRYVKMLNIILPDWESNSELYRIRVNDFVEALTIKAVERLQNNENIEDLISKSINTCDIYNEVVSISNIDVKLYKIEEDRQIQITWDIVARNSGGEGFLSAFVILSSLLSYMRRDETDIFASNEDGKVIIMDNPFAQTSSAHLLKPFMDIAKKSNTQLICLSDLGGDSIYNRFDNIYVLNLIASKLKSGLKYLKSDHVKGEENVERLVSSRFKMEEVAVEQMELF